MSPGGGGVHPTFRGRPTISVSIPAPEVYIQLDLEYSIFRIQYSMFNIKHSIFSNQYLKDCRGVLETSWGRFGHAGHVQIFESLLDVADAAAIDTET